MYCHEVPMAEQLHAVGHRRHDETTDDCAGHLADAARHGGATDERSRDGVELEEVTCLGLSRC